MENSKLSSKIKIILKLKSQEHFCCLQNSYSASLQDDQCY